MHLWSKESKSPAWDHWQRLQNQLCTFQLRQCSPPFHSDDKTQKRKKIIRAKTLTVNIIPIDPPMAGPRALRLNFVIEMTSSDKEEPGDHVVNTASCDLSIGWDCRHGQSGQTGDDVASSDHHQALVGFCQNRQSFDVLIIIQIKEHWALLTCQIPHCPMTQVKRRNNIVPQMFRRHLVTKAPSQSCARSSSTQEGMFWLTSWERPQSNQTWSLSPS